MGKAIDLPRLKRYDGKIKTYIGGEIKIKKIEVNGAEIKPDSDKTVDILLTPATIGAEVAGAASNAVSDHNEDQSAHPDIQKNFLSKDMLGAPNGVLQLNANGKIPSSLLPDTVAGQVVYLGVWNVLTGSAISDSRDPVGREFRSGDYFIASTNGAGGNGNYVPNINGAAGYTTSTYSFTDGDWLICNGSAWDKIDNSDAVISVAGRTGAVVLSASDVGLGNVENKPMDPSPKSGSANYITSGAVYTAVNGKQDKLTFDSTPTANSSNPVTSKGVYDSLAGKLPTTTKINGKSISNGSYTLTPSDIGALPTSTVIPSKVSQLTNDSGFLTEENIPFATDADIDGLFQ